MTGHATPLRRTPDRGWTGVVLAGGQSSRMGRDKALIEVDGMTLLERSIDLLRPHCREVLVMADPSRYEPLHAQVIPDDAPGNGPLGAIVTALRKARYGRLVVVACDLPHLSDRLIIRLKDLLDHGDDAVVPRHEGHVEPLAATYHRHALEPFERCLRHGNLRMTDALACIRTHYFDVTPGRDGWSADLFRNLNSPADL